MPYYATVIHSNDVDPKSNDAPMHVILHTRSEMVKPYVLGGFITKWKESFIADELPIDGRYPGAMKAFLHWLDKQRLGYIVPIMAIDEVRELPVYDIVDAPQF